MKDNVIQLNSSEKNFTDTIEDFPNRDWIEAGIKILREKSVEALTSKSISEEIKKKESEVEEAMNYGKQEEKNDPNIDPDDVPHDTSVVVDGVKYDPNYRRGT